MKRRLLVVAILALAGLAFAVRSCRSERGGVFLREKRGGQEPGLGERYEETGGGFSLRPLKDWQVREFPGLKYKIILGPPADGFAPNVNFVDEPFAGALKEYVASNITTMSKLFQKYEKISEAEIKTDAGVTGVKLVVKDEQMGKLVRQVFYLLDGPPGKKLVITCTALATDGEKWDAIFDASLKTFELKK